MKKRKRYKKLPDRTINIWNKYDFAMCGLGHKNMSIAKFEHIRQCLKWSCQRIVRGYADSDVWDMYSFIQKLMPAMLKTLKDTRMGSPGYLGENYTNKKGFLVNDTCHAEWDKILERMIFLWRESSEKTCRKRNPYEKEYRKASEKFRKKYGWLGQKLQTKEELAANRKRGGGCTLHTMEEVPEYKDIYVKYHDFDRRLEKYRSHCKDEALDMMKEYFYSLWD